MLSIFGLQEECAGCHFHMNDAKAPHACVAAFCVACQTYVSNFDVHVLENHLCNLTTCPFCDRDMCSLQLLEEHLIGHTKVKLKPSICIGCKTKFVTSDGRLGHECSNEVICKMCNVVYLTVDKLLEHQLSQHRNEPKLASEAKPVDCGALEDDAKTDGDVAAHDGECDTG